MKTRLRVLVLAGAAACRTNADHDSSDEGTTDTSGDSGSESESESETGEDGLPPTPELDSPQDGAVDLPTTLDLCWHPVEDPDGDEVRYRVFVDEMELTPNRPDGPQGYEGPCTGELVFDHEQTYTWNVQAFEADDPARESAPSETWTFTIDDDGTSQTVFEDNFDEDLGWEVEGDATSGHWVRGDTELVFDGEERSQPSECFGNYTCFFTGHNEDFMPTDEDVAGGSTVLLSPTFDLSGADAATIQVARWFYKSALEGGPLLRIELLVPEEDDPDVFVAHELESLDDATSDDPQNLWLPVEWAACDVPMRAGSRLRITATDEGSGVLESAIDSVSVHAHQANTVCESGEGSICDPELGDAACTDDLLCCPQGSLNAGINRCTPAVAGLDFDDPPPTVDDPNNGPLGCDAPDLFVEDEYILPVAFSDIWITEETCELWEGCVGQVGVRTIMRFTTSTPNIGSRDLVLGVPANNPDLFHFSECHTHYHFDEYARYQLFDGNDEVMATGHKQAFCLLDSHSWAWPFEIAQFDCANQGLSRGWTDLYEDGLPCQWVDVTDVAPGDYTLRITLNQPRPDAALPVLIERDYGNNMLEVAVTIP